MPFDSCPWVGLVVYLGQVLEVKVCIYLGGADIRVAKEFLDATQIVARFQQVGGKRVPEQVWIDFGANALFSCPVINTGLHGARAQAGSFFADKKCSLIGCRQYDPFLQPGRKRLEGIPTHRQDTILVAFARHAGRRIGTIDVAKIETCQFSQPQSARIQELEHRPVACHQGPFAREIKETRHPVGIEVLRQPLAGFRCAD